MVWAPSATVADSTRVFLTSGGEEVLTKITHGVGVFAAGFALVSLWRTLIHVERVYPHCLVLIGVVEAILIPYPP